MLCGKCKVDLDIEMFNKKGTKRDGTIRYQPFCKECNKIACREWYAKKENKQRIIDKVNQYKKDKRAWLAELKTTLVCKQCGESHPACLDFHHRNPREKEFMLSEAYRHGYDTIRNELTKCDVLCANCHRKTHWEIPNQPEPNS